MSVMPVWSVGVVLWEIAVLGQRIPYDHLPNSNDVVFEVVAGTAKLEPPADCPSFLCQLIQMCLHQNPDERPSSATLLSTVDSLLVTPSSGSQVYLIQLAIFLCIILFCSVALCEQNSGTKASTPATVPASQSQPQLYDRASESIPGKLQLSSMPAPVAVPHVQPPKPVAKPIRDPAAASDAHVWQPRGVSTKSRFMSQIKEPDPLDSEDKLMDLSVMQMKI